MHPPARHLRTTHRTPRRLLIHPPHVPHCLFVITHHVPTYSPTHSHTQTPTVRTACCQQIRGVPCADAGDASSGAPRVHALPRTAAGVLPKPHELIYKLDQVIGELPPPLFFVFYTFLLFSKRFFLWNLYHWLTHFFSSSLLRSFRFGKM
jgi:hypothetical protein